MKGVYPLPFFLRVRISFRISELRELVCVRVRKALCKAVTRGLKFGFVSLDLDVREAHFSTRGVYHSYIELRKYELRILGLGGRK